MSKISVYERQDGITLPHDKEGIFDQANKSVLNILSSDTPCVWCPQLVYYGPRPDARGITNLIVSDRKAQLDKKDTHNLNNDVTSAEFTWWSLLNGQ